MSKQKFIPDLAVAEITESPLNPRKLYDPKYLQELAESIRTHGVLTPILVRKVGDSHEIVYGHCRVRAAKMAGAETVPATVAEMSDVEVLEAQVVENGKRRDVTPIEEGEAYRTFHERFGVPVEDIAKKVGRSPAHIYQRMQLATSLPKDAIEALIKGQMSISVGLALARIRNPKLRGQATKEVLEVHRQRHWDPETHSEVDYEERMSTEKALAHIRTRYTLRLDGCGFPLDDETLLPKAGACAKCGGNSSNTPMLFDMAPKDALCGDPDCFAAKRNAFWKREKAALEEKGRQVVDGKKAEEVFYGGGQVKRDFVDLKEKNYDDPKNRTFKQLLGKTLPEAEVIVARDPDGQVHEVVPRKVAEKLLKEAGRAAGKSPGLSEAEKKANAKERAQREKQRHEAREKEILTELVIEQCVLEAEGFDLEGKLWHLVARVMLSQGDYYNSEQFDSTARRRRLVTVDDVGADAGEALRAKLDKMTVAQARGLVLELALERASAYANHSWNDAGKKALELVCKAFTVMPKKLEIRAFELRKREEEALAEAKKAKAGKRCVLEPDVAKHCADCKEKHCAGRPAGKR